MWKEEPKRPLVLGDGAATGDAARSSSPSGPNRGAEKAPRGTVVVPSLTEAAEA